MGGTAWPAASRASSSRCRSWPTTGSTRPARMATCCSCCTAGSPMSACTRRAERWDRTSLAEQESLIGRHKVSGAPLGSGAETDIPAYADDPAGERVPLEAHIRLANPRDRRSTGKELLRRGFSYSRGVDSGGQLDQGLAFISYQRRLAHFLEASERLRGERLEEYVRPEGGGFFYVLPGVTDDGDWLGRPLL